jgi:cytochrome c oxidase subunit 2
MVQGDAERVDHGATVSRIISERFPYPDADQPNWLTIRRGQDTLPNGESAPDIAPADLAVLDVDTGAIVMVAVVEDGAVDDEAALTRWLPASRHGPLFLFVPAVHVSQAEKLSHELGVRLAGLRGWGLTISAADARSFASPSIFAVLPAALRPTRFRPLASAVRAIKPVRIPRPADRSDFVALVLIWAAVTAVSEVLTVFVVNDLMFPTKGAEEAHTIDEAFEVMTYMAAPVFGLVVAVLLFTAFRFRADGPLAGDGPASHGRGWTPWVWLGATTSLTIAVIIFPGLTGLAELRENQHGDLVINVEASQFVWEVEYEDSGVQLNSILDEMVLPVDTRLHFKIDATDVLHSFWVPAFRMKIDAVPGRTTELFVTPDRVGGPETEVVYRVQCAELCGAGHAQMVMDLRVVEQDEFNAWLTSRMQSDQPAVSGVPSVRVDVELNEWNVIPNLGSVAAGTINFAAANTGSTKHELVAIRTDLAPNALPTNDRGVAEDQLDVKGRTSPLIDPGQLDAITVELAPGAYVLICNIPAHYALGMRAAFTVTE